MTDETNEASATPVAPAPAAHVEDAPRRGRPPKAETKMFPVLLARNYRPGCEFQVFDKDKMRDPTSEELEKVRAGEIISVPVEVAREIIANGIATRNDPIA